MLASAGAAKCVTSPSSILRLRFMLFDVLVHPGNNISIFFVGCRTDQPNLVRSRFSECVWDSP